MIPSRLAPFSFATYGEIASVARQREFVDVPVQVIGESSHLAGREIRVPERQELGTEIGREIHALAVGRENAAPARRLGVRRFDLAQFPAFEVVDVQVAFVDGHEAHEQQRLAVRRPVGHVPAGLRCLEYHRRRAPVERVFDIDVGVDAGSHRPRECVLRAVMRPDAAAGAPASVGKADRIRTRGIEVFELVILVAADVARVGNALARTRRRPVAVRDRLVEERELPARAHRMVHEVELAGVAESRADRDLPVGRPAGEDGASRKLVAPQALHEFRRNFGDSLDREIAAGYAFDVGRLGAEGEQNGEKCEGSHARILTARHAIMQEEDS